MESHNQASAAQHKGFYFPEQRFGQLLPIVTARRQMQVGGAYRLGQAIALAEVATHGYAGKTRQALVERHGSNRIGSQRRVRRIHIARLEPQPEQMPQPNSEGRRGKNEQK